MIISVDKIRSFLNDNTSYKILNEDVIEEEYILASLKNIIKRGIYYIEKDYIKIVDLIENSLVITNAEINNLPTNNTFIIVDDPQIIFYKLCNFVKPKIKSGIHMTAIIDDEAKLGKNIYIGPYSVIGKCVIEDNCFIDSHVIIKDNVQINKNTRIEPNSYIGANGVAWVWDKDDKKIIQPQFGGVIIEENCFIGSDVSIVRGSLNEDTIIGRGSLIAHGSKIGHGSQIQELCHLANNVSLAGNSVVGKRSFLGAACVLSSHVSIADDTIVGAGAVVTKSFKESNVILMGLPAKAKKINSIYKKMNGIPRKK